jgi:acetyl/propionyl-CoA carboxylase alpha subunit
VAVSSAGNHDNNIYNQWWGETHDGVTEVDKKVKARVEIKKDTLNKEIENDMLSKEIKNDMLNKEIKKDTVNKEIKKDTVNKEIKKDTVTIDKKKETEKAFKAEIAKNQDIVKNLKGHLLLVHGDIDNNVHPGNTLRVVDALVKANKRFDFMMLPGQRHGFGNATAYFDRMMWYYFAEHLLGDYRTNVELTDF